MEKNTKLRKDRNVKHTSRVHVFGGLLFCGKCGSLMFSTPAGSRDGWSHSHYHCSNRRRSRNICNQMSISDTKVGEFILNLVLNMLNAQSAFSDKTTPKQLESMLLFGSTFLPIASIEQDSLNDLYNILSSGKVSGNIYGKGADIKPTERKTSNITKLKTRRKKIQRALDRLQELYLFSEDAISQKDYILQRSNLEDELDEIDQQLSLADINLNESDDEIFLQKASEFIIAKNLIGRNYIYYKRLAKSVEQSVLKSFIQAVIDKIVVTDGRFDSVTFRNGIHLSFNYKKES